MVELQDNSKEKRNDLILVRYLTLKDYLISIMLYYYFFSSYSELSFNKWIAVSVGSD